MDIIPNPCKIYINSKSSCMAMDTASLSERMLLFAWRKEKKEHIRELMATCKYQIGFCVGFFF